jgi:16S rRNA (cytosine1402-N4)-methyltransferase
VTPSPEQPHRRRVRYPGKYPRRFDQKYKEHNPEQHPDTIAKVLASGKTPAGSHRPVMLEEVLEVLAPTPGEVAVDCTLGYGGHAEALLARIQPGGRLLGLDSDPVELPKTEARLRALGFGSDVLLVRRTNFAALPQALVSTGWQRADLVLADLGVSSMQFDDPARGFSLKQEGPLDMRMNPGRGRTAASIIQTSSPAVLATLLQENADESHAAALATALAGRDFQTTLSLAAAVKAALPRTSKNEQDLTVRRVFQAFRIAVNDEFSALETLLRLLPSCLSPGGRAAIISFHSGEDRRVKKAFAAGLRAGLYSAVAEEPLRPSPDKRNANPRSAPAKLRWARA